MGGHLYFSRRNTSSPSRVHMGYMPTGRAERKVSAMQAALEQKIHTLGESLDRLVSIDINNRGVIHELYRKAREWEGHPLTSAAALALHKAVQPGRPVFLLTGFPSLTWLFEGILETDGPAGSAVLARVLEQTRQAVPVFLTAEPYFPYIRAALEASGLLTADIRTAMLSKQERDSAPVAALQAFPTRAPEAEAAAGILFRHYAPSAVIGVEMPGQAKDGSYHTFTGRTIPAYMVPQGEVIFRFAQRKGILTVGFGDGGNELGMGRIAPVTARVVPNGEKIAAVTPADMTVPAAVSNWGAYAVAAALAAAGEQPLVFREIDIPRIIRRIVDAGGVDGVTNRPVEQEDGVPAAVTGHMVQLISHLLLP